MTKMAFPFSIFHFFSLIYNNGSFLFISNFSGDGRGGDGELKIKRPWPKLGSSPCKVGDETTLHSL